MTSTIKVNNIQNQCGANIINENSNTITIGASGDTIALASGASQTGFGREGSVDWQTGSIKTTTFTATSGEGYFVDTSSGGVTCNLPAGSAGAIVAFADYTRTFGTNAFTVTPNGSEKIGGVAASMLLETNGEAATLVYVDGTEGWINVQQTETSQTGNPFLIATGGTITTSGNCKIHTFTGPGTFTVSQISTTAAENTVSHLVLAGGGGGGSNGGGGGAGGFREVKSPLTPYTASPLDGYPSAPNRVTVTATSFPITVGGGGAGGPGANVVGTNGVNSIFSTITSAGGGGGGKGSSPMAGTAGGSGGGAGRDGSGTAGGAGNTPPVSPAQGFAGGASQASSYGGGGGGGGATAVGADGTGGNPSNEVGGNGGAGATTSITASPATRAGGGGGGVAVSSAGGTRGTGGSGGGGTGGGTPSAHSATNAVDNEGGGGGGGGDTTPTYQGGNGGSGLVVIRYKYQ